MYTICLYSISYNFLCDEYITPIYVMNLFFRNGSRVRLSPWATPKALQITRAPVHAHEEAYPAQAAPVGTHEEEGPLSGLVIHVVHKGEDPVQAAHVVVHEGEDPVQAAHVVAHEGEDPVQATHVVVHEGEDPVQAANEAAPVDSHAAIMAEIEMLRMMNNKLFFVALDPDLDLTIIPHLNESLKICTGDCC